MDLFYNIKANKYKAKKALGQNFLVDSDTIEFIVDYATKEDEILEIGPGLGFVTRGLIENSKKVISVELDKDMVNVLENELGQKENFELIQGDILKTNIENLNFKDDKIKVIANIPYYITSPILAHLLGEIDDINNKNRNKISKILLMVQKEVANRIVANENSNNKEYGALTILCNMWAEVKIVKNVSKKCFNPSPKVDSCLVEFSIQNEPKVPVTRLLKRTVKAIFNTRRKNIKNALMIAGFLKVPETLEKIGIDPNFRGEKLSIEEMSKLSVALEEFN